MSEQHLNNKNRQFILQALATGSLLSFSADGAPRSIIDHTDDELIMLESLLGRKPPFST